MTEYWMLAEQPIMTEDNPMRTKLQAAPTGIECSYASIAHSISSLSTDLVDPQQPVSFEHGQYFHGVRSM